MFIHLLKNKIFLSLSLSFFSLSLDDFVGFINITEKNEQKLVITCQSFPPASNNILTRLSAATL